MLGKLNTFRSQFVDHTHDFSNKSPRYLTAIGFLIMFPFYFWSSGYPQVADLFFLAVCGPLLLTMFLQIKRVGSNDILLFMFAFLTLLINSIHYINFPDIRFFLSSGYYIYNAFIFIYFRHAFSAHSSEKTAQTLLHLFIGMGIFLLFVGMAMNAYLGGRLISTFNNPNQLAYWCVLVSCITVVLNQKNFGLAPLSILLMCTIMIIMTVSRNGLIIMMAIWVVSLLTTKTTANVKYIMLWITVLFLIFASILGISIFTSDGVSGTYIDAFTRRFMLQDTFLDAVFYNRGYGRILEEPFWVLVGAGEGGFARFPYGTRELELHSGLATLIFGYGIAGTALFFLFIYQFLKRATTTEFSIIMLLMAFNVTHQAIRFSMFWVFLGILAYIQLERAKLKHALAHTQPQDQAAIIQNYEYVEN